VKDTAKEKSSKAESKTESKASKAQAKPQQKKQQGGKTKYLVGIILVLMIIAIAVVANSFFAAKPPNTNFSAFKKNFDAAPRINIFVYDPNGTVYQSTFGCASSVIIQIIANKTEHRNSSTIDFNVVNQTTCIRSNGLGGAGTNYTTTSVQSCLATTSTEPTLYINYSTHNTTIIRPDYLYVSGDALFLRECGVASEIS
jgi:hypothetical protein